MWDLKACPWKILRIRPAEIEFESNFSSISQYLRSTEYSTFLIAKKLRIKPSEIECEADFSSLSKYIYLFDHWKFWGLNPLKLNFRVILASLYSIVIYLSDCRIFLRMTSLRLNVRTISACSLSQYNYLLNTFLIVVLGWLFY